MYPKWIQADLDDVWSGKEEHPLVITTFQVKEKVSGSHMKAFVVRAREVSLSCWYALSTHGLLVTLCLLIIDNIMLYGTIVQGVFSVPARTCQQQVAVTK